LGDIIDGYGDDDSYSAAAKTSKDLKQVVGLISSSLQDTPARHVLGNHCLAAPRKQLLEVSRPILTAAVAAATGRVLLCGYGYHSSRQSSTIVCDAIARREPLLQYMVYLTSRQCALSCTLHHASRCKYSSSVD
jgi:hypothetical protein